MTEVLDRLRDVATILDRLAVPWVLGGSLASSIYGEPRPTNDIDLAVQISVDDIDRLVGAFEEDFYIDAGMISDAIRHSSSFNLIHYASSFKIDMFVSGDSILDRRQMESRERKQMPDVDDLAVWIAPPMEQVLRKVWWFQQGSGVSDRQWRDVMYMLKQQEKTIDHVVLLAVGRDVGIGDLVERALRQLDEWDD